MYRHDIIDPDTGQVIAWNVLADFNDVWPWITGVAQHLHGCDYAAIDIRETDNGDALTVHGQIVGYLPVPIRVCA